MPGQDFRRPASNAAKRSGSEVGVWSSLRTWTWAMVAPASKAARVDSSCSLTVIGTAGLCSLRGTDPVIATVMMHGVVILTATARSDLFCPAPYPWGTPSADSADCCSDQFSATED